MTSTSSSAAPLALWAGIESTINRIGDRFFEQLDRTGHAQRLDDLDRVAALGVSAVRYPVLWERTAPNGVEQADWRWSDERLHRLQALHITPIVGLLHHGSGPRSTSLVDPAFPQKFAHYARTVAERYPWVDQYTPINEPLTTARFSGLYGFWYPHGRDDATFARVLVTQCRAVVLAMRAIREVNPHAQCIQNDDLGKVFSTPLLRYEAEFQNERRWLSWDLLCGRITPDHPLWDYLRRAGVGEEDLLWFGENPCPPDIIGVDYYLTSERFLDEHRSRYPADLRSGNEHHEYADVPAVRVRRDGIVGPAAILREAWERYHLPVAITEAHNGCTREEQLRWLRDMWQAAQDARQAGVDVRAVTAWSVFGSYDWNSLVTRDANHYEPGVYDIRAPTPRPTAISPLLQDLARGRPLTHPVLQHPGWWQRPLRLLYGVAVDDAGHATPSDQVAPPPAAAPAQGRRTRPLLITHPGMLGQTFAQLCEVRGLPYRLLRRRDLRRADSAAIRAMLRELDPWAVVNTASYERVDAAECDAAACLRANADAAAVLATACAAHGVPLLTFSSDLVFDGQRTRPYVESDPVAPLGVYGRSKALAEAQVLQVLPDALVVRAGACFGPWDGHNFVLHVIEALAAGRRVRAADDIMVSPTYVPDLVHGALDLLIDGERGVWHVANNGAVTWADLARRVAAVAGCDPAGVDAHPSAAVGWTAPRPRYSVLSSERGTLLPALDDALARYGAAWARGVAMRS